MADTNAELLKLADLFESAVTVQITTRTATRFSCFPLDSDPDNPKGKMVAAALRFAAARDAS